MSTLNSLMRFVQDVKHRFNQKKSTLAVFIYFKGVYNTVWRSKLMSKLSMYRVRGSMLSWFGRFLAQRCIKVWLDEAESKYKQSKIGLLQGAVSSTILFKVYINDLPEQLKNIEGLKVSMFAHDIVIWPSAKNYNKQQEPWRKL